MSKADQLAKLVLARDAGELSPEDFEAAKHRVLTGAPVGDDEPSAEASTDESPLAGHRLRNRRRALIVAGLIVVALIVWVIVGLAGLSPARFTLDVRSVTATSSDSVALSVVWHNHGDQGGVGTCTIATAVHDAVGTLVETELSTISTDGPVAAGGHQDASVTVVVNASDAQHVARRDVTVSSCS